MKFFSKLSQSLKKTTSGIEDALRGVVGLPNGRVPEDVLDELEEALIVADVGVEMASAAVDALRAQRFTEADDVTAVKRWLAGWLAEAFVAQPPAVEVGVKPHVVLMLGVNGAGKTTTLGKLAAQYRAAGKTVLMAAGDTYRAGAAAQLKVWAERAAVDFVQSENVEADPAGFLFGAYEKARDEGYDVLLCDTAGRLQNRADLMDELGKIVRVLQKQDETLPHETLLVLDATVGQNALRQVEEFLKMAPVSGLVVSKLDGSAKAGVVVAVAAQFNLPIVWVGMGEALADLTLFSVQDFCEALVGLEGVRDEA